MMQKFQLVAVLFLFVLLLSKTEDSTARKLAAKEDVDVLAIQISSKDSVLNQENSDSFDKLIADCQNEDEECLKRRVISEAHLDYIYTQHHKP